MRDKRRLGKQCGSKEENHLELLWFCQPEDHRTERDKEDQADRPESAEQLNRVIDRNAPVHGYGCVQGFSFVANKKKLAYFICKKYKKKCICTHRKDKK